MITFIDESGKFVQNDGWSVVAALTLTHGFAALARRKLITATRDWPRVDGELKGRSLNEHHLEGLVDILWRHQALLHVVAVNVGLEDADGIRRHRLGQAEKMTQHLTDEHHPQLVSEVKKLRSALEAMPDQLYIQSVAMTELLWECAQNAAIYFSMRKPEELGQFEWKIDAKSPTGVTKQEHWWKSVLGPIFESNPDRHEFFFLDDKEADYSFFDQTYAIQNHAVWRPTGYSEETSGFDIGKLIVKPTQFVNSKSDILMQSADILANRVRRCLQEPAMDDRAAAALGRMQIRRSRQGAEQVVKIISLTAHEQNTPEFVLHRLKQMYRSARSMWRSERPLASPQ
ncbi:DUF3800 domain-containing protein [Bradyrhizobium sp. UFLA05-112]